MKKQNESSIGLYWLNEKQTDVLHLFAEPVSSGEKYLDWIISSKDHYAYWDKLLNAGKTEIEDYEVLPRGRVSFKPNENTYTIYHGDWLTKELESKLKQAFNLTNEKVLFEYDQHYDVGNNSSAPIF